MTIDLCCSKKIKSKGKDEKKDDQGDECFVYQSPIELSETKSTIVASNNNNLSSCPSKKVADYKFDKKTLNWDVNQNVNVTIVNNEITYKMIEFHFHQKAEHVIDNNQGDIELHLVFQAAAAAITATASTTEEKKQVVNDEEVDENSGPIYVIGVIGKVGKRTSRIFKSIIQDKSFTIPCPQSSSLFSYAGSLTTPPFSLTVSWNVLSKMKTITMEDLEYLKRKSKFDRPIQPRDGRNINFQTFEKV